MEWLKVQAHLWRVFKASGLTQTQVAAAGGLSGQNAVSKVLNNKNLGPSVQNFSKVVEGLGMPLSEFFLQMERGDTVDLLVRRPGEITAIQTKPGTGKSFVIDTVIEALQRAQGAAEPPTGRVMRRRKR